MLNIINFSKTIILIFIFTIFIFQESSSSENKKNKVSVKANEALEWFQNENKLIAKGKVEIKIDEVQIKANKVTVFYDGEINQSNIVKMIAQGEAEFKENDTLVFSNTIDYDFISEKIILTGQNINVLFPNIVIHSDKKLDFYKKSNSLDIFGNTSIEFDKTQYLNAIDIKVQLNNLFQIEYLKTFTKSFYKSLDKELKIYGNKMYYDHNKSLLEIEDKVVIDQGKNKLRGDFAKVDIAKGISTVLSKNSSYVSGEFINNE